MRGMFSCMHAYTRADTVFGVALRMQVQSFTLSRPEAKEALEAAQALSQRLQAAVDSRQLRTVVPNARPLDLLTQDTQQRAEVRKFSILCTWICLLCSCGVSECIILLR